MPVLPDPLIPRDSRGLPVILDNYGRKGGTVGDGGRTCWRLGGSVVGWEAQWERVEGPVEDRWRSICGGGGGRAVSVHVYQTVASSSVRVSGGLTGAAGLDTHCANRG